MDYAKALLVIALAVTAGCLSGVDADEVRDDAVEEMADLETYSYELDMEMEMAETTDVIEDPDDSGITMTMDMTGEADEAEREMSMVGEMSMLAMFNFDYEAYVFDDTMYMKMGFGGEEEWVKMEGDDYLGGVWEANSYADQYRELLEISDVEYDSDGEVDGTEAHVLTLHPDPAEYDELVRDQMGMMEMGEMKGFDELYDEDSFETVDISVTYWISTDDRRVLRSTSEAVMNVSTGFGEFEEETDDLGADLFADEMAVGMEMDMRFSDHNQPVSIELPAEAENATELPAFDEDFDEEDFDDEFGFGDFDDDFEEPDEVADNETAPEHT